MLSPNVQFGKMAALSRPKFCLCKCVARPNGIESRRLRQAAGTLSAICGQHSAMDSKFEN